MLVRQSLLEGTHSANMPLALVEVLHNEVDQTMHWMISLHTYKDVFLGNCPG
jgi:hypothetical protein